MAVYMGMVSLHGDPLGGWEKNFTGMRSVAAWQQASMAAWQYGSMAASKRGSVAAWQRDSVTA